MHHSEEILVLRCVSHPDWKMSTHGVSRVVAMVISVSSTFYFFQELFYVLN